MFLSRCGKNMEGNRLLGAKYCDMVSEVRNFYIVML